MNFAVMPAAQRDGKLITDFAAKRGALCGAQMMGIRRASAANKAWLFSNRFDVRAIANPTRRWERQDAFVNYSGCAPLFGLHRTSGHGLDRRTIDGVDFKVCQPRLEGCLDALGIDCRQGVFVAKNPMSPMCDFISRAKILQLPGKLVS
jgi:hypothetical protein